MRRTSFKALPEWPSIKSLRQDENVHMEKAETPCWVQQISIVAVYPTKDREATPALGYAEQSGFKF
jgi:hypothetical protein